MKLSTDINQNLSSNIVKFNWILLIATIFFGMFCHKTFPIDNFFELVCCTCIHSKPTDVEQLNEHQIIDSFYPAYLYSDDLVERAAPRLGRASPRFGRASPRLGRRAPAYILSHINHAGRYYIGDDDAINDYPLEFDSSVNEKRAAPRLGRST